MIDAICKEISLRKNYLEQHEVSSIYFGGGTPSSLPAQAIEKIIHSAYSNHPVSEKAEITLEANPDDLSPDYIKQIKKLGVNRLSIGVQSFINSDLEWMNRTHNASQAINSIGFCKNEGLDNLNIDLIYGLPGQIIDNWTFNIQKSLELKVPHISAYHLTYEPGTVLNYRLGKKEFNELGEDHSVKQFHVLISHLKQAGFIHYEISNFAKQGFFSIHNLGYWSNQHYIGIGPSAHSFDGNSRQWNYPRNKSYIQAIHHGLDYFETENLDKKKKFNEYIMTSLRTIWGIELDYIRHYFGEKYLEHITNKKQQYMNSGDLSVDQNNIRLTDKGKLISDYILQDLFL